jgi:exopolysaccharide production protein ExoQ
VTCLMQSRDEKQRRAVEWYLAIVLLTLIYNLDESFLFEPRHLGSLMFVLVCVGLKLERMRLQSAHIQKAAAPLAIERRP